MKYLILFLVVLVSCGRPAEKLFKAKKPTDDVSLKGLSTVMEIDEAVLSKLVADHSENIELQVPYKGGVLDLELTESNIFAPDFVVRTDKEDNVPYQKGLFYTGKVKGDAESMVTMALFEGDVNGIIASPTLGDLNLGKRQEVSLEYTLADPNMFDTLAFECGTVDEGMDADEIQLLRDKGEVSLSATNTCVTVDFEMSYSNFQQFGSVAAVTNWITSIFASIKTVYANEGITIVIKSVFVHTAPDGYNANPATALNQLRERRTNDPNFTGSVVHYVRGKTSGFSGIAYVGVTCVNQYQYGLSDVQFGYNPYPAYSWTIMVLCHELGHNFGSMHTQWCGWPGGPIDGCVTAEGGCANGPLPAKGKGTIMSYCHLNQAVGTALPNGFGTLPGGAIRAHIGATTCANCGLPPTPTCADGVKNGTETGVDCGGNCPPCATCSDGILNNGETSVDCGGPNCAPCPPPTPTDPLVSQGKPTKQSTQYRGYVASAATDGRDNTFNHTEAEKHPYIRVDLLGAFKITKIAVYNRIDCCQSRITRFRVFVTQDSVVTFDTPGWLYEYKNPAGLPIGASVEIKGLNAVGRYLTFIADNGISNSYLHLRELKAFGTPSGVICKDTVFRVSRVVLVDSTGQICR